VHTELENVRITLQLLLTKLISKKHGTESESNWK